MAEVIIVKNQEEAGELYGRSVADLIKAKPNAVLGLATGSSPLAAYQALAEIVKEESIDVSQVQGFALDEYIGLPLTHPESYHATIHRTVVAPLGLDPAKVHVPGDVLNGTSLEDGEKVAGAGAAYDAAIEAAGGIDVQILGIGTDGHVGFNEPGSSLASGTRVKTLTERTRIDNARFFDNDINQVPSRSARARPRRSRRPWRAASARSARPRRSRCTRTPRSSWTRRPPAACATRTTTGTRSSTSRPGRRSDRTWSRFPSLGPGPRRYI